MIIVIPVLFATFATASPWEPVDRSDSGDQRSAAPAAIGVDDGSIDAHHVPTDTDPVADPVVDPGGAVDGQAGPNHGQIVRESHTLTDRPMGCVTRQIAQSDLGKKNADPDADGPALLDDGSIDPDSVDLECTNGGDSARRNDPDTGKPEKTTPEKPENAKPEMSEKVKPEKPKDTKPHKPSSEASGS